MWGGFGLKCEEKLEVSLIIFVLDYLVEVEIKEFLKMWRSDPNVKGFFFFFFFIQYFLWSRFCVGAGCSFVLDFVGWWGLSVFPFLVSHP